ncbi:MAG: DUF167 domain-containing protein [Alphaproteobacteria bacterium]
MLDRPWDVLEAGIRLQLRVTPRARRNGILDTGDGAALKVSVTAPPADGKANAAVCALLANALRVPKSSLSVTSGAAGRDKRIHIAGDGPTLISMLEALVNHSA